MAKSVLFKTLSKSIYTCNMIKGGGQGGLKRKNYRPQVAVGMATHLNIDLDILF